MEEERGKGFDRIHSSFVEYVTIIKSIVIDSVPFQDVDVIVRGGS